MADHGKDSGKADTVAGATAGSSWSVRGMDAGTREIAAAAARAGGMPVGAWVDRTILRAAGQTPDHVTAPTSPPAPEDDPTGLIQSFAKLDARHAEAEARFAERLNALGNDVETLADGIDALDRRTTKDQDAAGAPPEDGEISPPPAQPPRPRARRVATAAAVAFLVAAVVGGGWVFHSLTEAPEAEKPSAAARKTEHAKAVGDAPAPVPTEPTADDSLDPLETAAKNGDAKAQHDLAVRLADGNGGPPDYEAAARWFTTAALQGLPNAQYNLGVLYEKGLGVQKDDREAWVWYRSAAEQGHGQAQYNLGVAHVQGRGMPRDDAEAVLWFRHAAEQGVAEAHFNLALLLEKGRGVERDLDAARRHYVEAAAGGVEDARDRLAGLRAAETADGTLAKALGRAEVAEIQTLLATLDFDPGPADGNFSARSREAARLFQRFAGLPETGEPSHALLEELRAVSGLVPR